MRSSSGRARLGVITPTALLCITLALAAPSAASSGTSSPDDQPGGAPTGPEVITVTPSAELADWTPLQVLDGARGRVDLRNQTTGNGTSVVSWRAYTEGCADGLWASVRRPGAEAWEPPLRMGGANPSTFSVAVGDRKWAFAAYDTCFSKLFVHRLLDDGWGEQLEVPVPADFDGLSVRRSTAEVICSSRTTSTAMCWAGRSSRAAVRGRRSLRCRSSRPCSR